MTTKSSNSQVITCKAAVCWGDGEELKVENIQVDPPKSSEVRLKMLYASFCHTDILCSHGFPIPVYPRVLGHEGVGVVESIGDEVKDLKEGDIVMPAYVGQCQDCEKCNSISRKTNLCLKYPLNYSGLMPDGTSRMSIKGQKLYHLLSCSTWSEYTVVDVNYVVKIDPRVNLAHASFLSCGFSTGFGSVWKVANVEKGSSVAIIGLGAVGLGAIEAAIIEGAIKIIGVDTNERKKEKGEVFGMTDFINPNESEKSISEQIKQMTGGLGVDYCLECTGVPSLLNESLLATKQGIGKTIVVGAGTEPNVQISFLPLLCGGNLMGCIFGGLKIKSDIPLLLDKCTNKELHLDELLTHEVALEDINKAFQLVKQPNCVKVLIKI
ncbi:8-hydroxygeraniol oxidoreductase-like isoform X2 [Mercurialis annua]|uniref:8-hydroxygeraniol oxidoreductase-like isoform X2 n=1 Tax=Mercurialis annua TaxID=3986 RepID=UPI00215F3BAF|nr:8-hydroxygeraniol oxidoreductase-like isoform X2 [Mercurialis annua]